MGNRHYRTDRAILEISEKQEKSNSKKTKELNAFMVGLDGAGKSTILYKHMARSTYSSIPMQIPQTITYNVETISPRKPPLKKIKNPKMRPLPPIPPIQSLISNHTYKPFPLRPKSQSVCGTQPIWLNIYDYGGGVATRKLWTNFKQLKIGKLQRTGNRIDFFILVIDSSDFRRLNEVQMAMNELLNARQHLSVPLCIFANKQDLNGSMSASVLPYRLEIKRIKVLDLIAVVKYTLDIHLEERMTQKILSFLPNVNYYWNMSKRHWTVFETQTVSEYCKGISDGIQWLYSEYARKGEKSMSKFICI